MLLNHAHTSVAQGQNRTGVDKWNLTISNNECCPTRNRIGSDAVVVKDSIFKTAADASVLVFSVVAAGATVVRSAQFNNNSLLK